MAVLNEETRSSRKKFAGVALLVAITIVLALVIYPTYYPGSQSSSISRFTSATIESSSSTSSTPTTSLSQASSQVKVQLLQLVQEYMENCICSTLGIRDYYQDSSSIKVYGNGMANMSSGFTVGTTKYSGHDNIVGLYGSFWGALRSSPTLSTISNMTLEDLGGGNVNATFHVFENGTSNDNGIVKSTIDIHQLWTSQGGAWRIQQESWDFTTMYIQYPGIIIRGG